jgi:uncharacterized membrane protein YfcA
MTIEQIILLDYWMILPLFVLGSMLHFVYEWSNHNKAVAVIAAVNESYWEHIKIAFWPVFILYLYEYILGGWKYAAFIPAKTIALYSIPISMVAIVSLYKLVTKKNVLFIDISVFFITIYIAQVLGTKLLSEITPSIMTTYISVFFLLVIVLAFLFLTIKPPKDSDIFKDPLTNKYGTKGHK